MNADELLALGELMNRPITITRGENVLTGTLAGLTVYFTHSGGPRVSLSVEGFVRFSLSLEPGDVVTYP